MSDRQQAAGGGFSISGLLGVLFVGLKLTHHIDWDWVWVLAPFWFPFAFVGVALVFMIIVAAVLAFGGWIFGR